MDVVDDDHHLNNSSDPKPKRPRNDFEVNEFPAMSTFFDNDSIEDENVTTAGGWSIISTATGQTNVATAAGGSRSSATGEVKIWNDSKNDSGDRWNYSDEDELPDLEQQGEAVVKMEESSIAVASATTWDRIAHKFRDRSSLFNYVTVKLVDMYYNGDCDNGSRSLFDKSGSTSDDNMDLEESEKGEMVIKAVDASASRRRRVLEQMYAEGPAMNQLFEGVSDAVHRLHKAVTECPEETQETSDPSGLMIPLMQHQRQALTWILWREKQVPGGGILADDMGLGKTLTMIALILMKKQLRNQVQEEPDENLKVVLNRKDLVPSNTTLVVCPASVMHQWKNEIERRVKPGYLKIHLFHGDRKKRERYPYRLAQFDIVLTTYGLVASEIGEPELPPDVECNESCDEKLWREIRMEKSNDSVLSRVAWERIILDEAHVIRNYKTSTAKGCCRIPAGSRWCLSGTPLHNDLMDLYSLLRFLRCSPFDEKRVWKIYIQDNRSRESKVRLSTIVKSLLLRRTKEQKSGTHGKPIIELTEKKFHIHNINLTKPEKSIYDRMHKFSQRKVEAFVNHQEHREDRELVVFSKGQCTSEKEKLTWKNPFLIYKKDKDGQVEQIDILVLLLRLRQACVHYALTKNIKAVMDGVDSIINGNVSGSMDKCVVVSQWTQLLDIFEHHLKVRGVRITRIDGSVPPFARQERVDSFNRKNKGPAVMLLSLTAGGVGLNLVGGNHLFLVDLHWNPALEQQAFDRIYRMGQQKNVFVHKFVCDETIEQRILDIQKQKLQLAKDVLQGAGKNLSRLTLRDLKYLFKLEKDPRKPAEDTASGDKDVVEPQQCSIQ